jgi:predicted amidohydrolase YtcJ
MSPSTPARADMVLLHGNVLTLDPRAANAQAQAVAIGGGRILAVGSDREAASWSAPTVVDLEGATVLPGFYDSHNHMLFTGQNLAQVDLADARSVDDVVRAIGARAKHVARGEWVQASSRWHESQLAEKRFPRREELDAGAPEHPVLIPRGGHNIVVNTLGLRLAGISRDTPNPDGGTIVRDAASGEPTGHLIDAAMAPVRARLPAPSDADLREALVSVTRAYNQAGITSIIDPGLGPREIGVYRALRDDGRLSVRSTVMWRLAPGFTDRALQKALEDLDSGAVAQDAADPWLRTISLKLGVDGGVEAGFYREPYAFTDDPTNPRGKPLMSGANFRAFAIEAARRGWQVGTHCVGDAAIDMVLDAYAAADAARSLKGRRWTLVHMMYARDDHWDAANRLELVVTAQQPLMYALADGFVKYLGSERAANIEPLAMYLARSSQPVGGGSDSPVTPYQPLLGIWSSVTRATQLAGVQGPEWAVTVDEALRMYTYGSAWAAREETTKGSIARGKLADLVVLDADPRSVEPDAIREINVVRTLVDGRVVYDRDRGPIGLVG